MNLTKHAEEDPDYFILSQLIKREEELIKENIKKIEEGFGFVSERYLMEGRLEELNRMIKLIRISQKWNTSLTPKRTLRIHAFYSTLNNLLKKYEYEKNKEAEYAIKKVMYLLNSKQYYKSQTTYEPAYFDIEELISDAKRKDTRCFSAQLRDEELRKYGI